MIKINFLITVYALLTFNLTFGQTQYNQLDTILVAILETIHEEDQIYRIREIEMGKKYGWDSEECNTVWKQKIQADSINLIKVKKIIDTRGWLGPQIIGEQGNKTLFLIIQHADINTQKKYLPILKEAIKNGQAKAAYYATMKDRVLIRQGEKQLYGSQLIKENEEWRLSPMIDPDNVDKRRAEVGLKPLADYLQAWDIVWNVEAFKKRMNKP